MRRKAEALRRDLCQCGPDVFMAMISPEGMEDHGFASVWMPNRLTRLRSLDEHAERLDLLIKWLDEAIRQLPKEKTGSKTLAARVVTSKIVELLMRYTKYKLTPGVKESDPGHALLAECFKRLCQSNGGSSTRRAHALFQMTIYAARARHSANAAERLCL